MTTTEVTCIPTKRKVDPDAAPVIRSQKSNGTVTLSNHSSKSSFPSGKANNPVGRPAGSKGTGWANRKSLLNAKTTLLSLSFKVLEDRLEAEGSDAELAFFTGIYPEGMVVLPDDWKANLKSFFRACREDIFEEGAFVESNFEYFWDGEFAEYKGLEQPHLNILTAATPREQYEMALAWYRIVGHSKTDLSVAAKITTPNREERRHKTIRQQIERAIHYFTMAGTSEKALDKKFQYKTPAAWLEAGAGKLWGYSKGIVKPTEVEVTITNKYQRMAFDTWMRENGSYKPRVVQWIDRETGATVDDPFDLAMWSPDRIYGSREAIPLTDRQIAQVVYLLDQYSDENLRARGIEIVED